MNQNKITGWSLIACAIAMIIGMIINVQVYWFITDILVFIICVISAVLLLKNRG